MMPGGQTMPGGEATTAPGGGETVPGGGKQYKQLEHDYSNFIMYI